MVISGNSRDIEVLVRCFWMWRQWLNFYFELADFYIFINVILLLS